MHCTILFPSHACYSVTAVSLFERGEAGPFRYSLVAVRAGKHEPEEQWVNGTEILDLQVLVICFALKTVLHVCSAADRDRSIVLPYGPNRLHFSRYRRAKA